MDRWAWGDGEWDVRNAAYADGRGEWLMFRVPTVTSVVCYILKEMLSGQ